MPDTLSYRPDQRAVIKDEFDPITLHDLVQALCREFTPQAGVIEMMLNRIERTQ